jgi:hypothetical protein
MNNEWLNSWSDKNQESDNSFTVDNDILENICTNGNNITIDDTYTHVAAIDISELNSDKLTFNFPEGKVELTYNDIKIMKKLIDHFGKELFPEEYI